MKNSILNQVFIKLCFDGLKTKAPVMMEKSRLCAIVFDEMAIKEHLSYDDSKDCVRCVEDLGFIGLVDKWKQPVVSFLASGTI